MSELNSRIALLEARLEALVRTQIDFQKEISFIRSELVRLRSEAGGPGPRAEDAISEPSVTGQRPIADESRPVFSEKTAPVFPRNESRSSETEYSKQEQYSEEPANAGPSFGFSNYVSSYVESARANLEEFIGENLINKIGIIVLILGVGIGLKYAIDNELISPLTRIIIGYLFGFGLIGFGMRLRAGYRNFSAVLVSGGMAIMYFVTYFAYSLYSLIPQSSAFSLMVIFTCFTVAAAIAYNRQVIAHIGLVGAYAVPFLLSSDSGNYVFLFAYISIINTGILAISIKRYWTPIFYTSFVFTWLIVYAWFITRYSASEHFYLAIIFIGIFFAIFFSTKIAHRVMYAEADYLENVASTLISAFVFYAFSTAIINSSQSTTRYIGFFTFLSVVTLAIILISHRFYGKAIIYLTYPFAWLIFGVWYANWFVPEEHFLLAVIFATVFFLIFYATALAMRLLSEETSLPENTGLVISNSFIFYGFGYSILDSRPPLDGYLGLYTAGHSALHYVVARVADKLRPAVLDVGQVLAILILTFATIAIPVQLDGNHVTLSWSVEAAMLLWFGRVRQVRLFEYFSYPVMILATGSLFLDWLTADGERTAYVSEYNRQVFANGDFVTALVFLVAFAFIYGVHRDERFESVLNTDAAKLVRCAIGCVGLFVLYNTFRIEISNYFHLRSTGLFSDSIANAAALSDISRFNSIWQIDFTLGFLAVLGLVNIYRLRSLPLAFAVSLLKVLALAILVTAGMVLLDDLRSSYMQDRADQSDSASQMNIAIRYISYLFAGGVLYSLFKTSKDSLISDYVGSKTRARAFDAVFYLTVLIIASCDLMNLMAQFSIPNAYKFGLTILWGIYALALIAIGIARYKKHLRIAAIVLLGITLIKLFLIDSSDLATIPKTVLFVSLGLLMLIVSFLYNKYKTIIFGVDRSEEV
jgi:uncharacterized membrane protein